MQNDAVSQPECMICGFSKSEKEGFYIVSEFVCQSCESEMIKTDVTDEKYPFFIYRMKQLLLNSNV
ncbi:sigma factor G inhibitor Gin [Paenibacillus yanchengensis]|uniref:Sigma factor G inhibitor Gin n=1 Tax=Paenibacillus yanchengensis TaxID=2035833 RepID=A0ABW4YJ40_9BACL